MIVLELFPELLLVFTLLLFVLMSERVLHTAANVTFNSFRSNDSSSSLCCSNARNPDSASV